jgi:hypothetical protein
MDIIGKKVIKTSDGKKVNDIGQVYRETKWNYQGHEININIDLDDNDRPIRYHGKVDRDNSTMKVNADEGGIVGWFIGLFGKK